jgi:hypothetical protein
MLSSNFKHFGVKERKIIVNRVAKEMFVCKTKLNTWEMMLAKLSFQLNAFYFLIY